MTGNSERDATLSRRAFLTTLAAGVVGGAATTRAAADGPYDAQEPYVSLDYDVDVLERYRPVLNTSQLDIHPSWLYSWVVRSEERSTDMACYWAWYSAGQDGVTSEDSHIPDREPIYVEFDPDSQEVVRVFYDEIHYFAGTARPFQVSFRGKRPELQVINPWHNYEVAPVDTDGDVQLKDMHDRYQAWLDNGWNVDRQTVLNPWRIRWRNHWWPEDSVGIFQASTTRATLWVNQTLNTNIDIPFRQT